ncbi:MAG: type II toxin-antitoxin system VapC family toxin [Pseudonocardiaceae bacterium]
MHLDTHVVAWLHDGQRQRIPEVSQRLLDTEPLAISPMVELEITYLFEIGRMSYPSNVVLADLAPLGLSISTASYSAVVRVAIGLRWARDPFDRIIAAQAIVDGVPLLTADQTIRAHLDLAVWD